MGKRRGITIHIRDHDTEKLVAEYEALRREIEQLRAHNMATMQEVQARLTAVAQEAENNRTVVEGVRTVVNGLVDLVGELRGRVGDPDAMMQGLDAIEGAVRGQAEVLAASVAHGTSAENEAPAPGPAPDVGPLQAAGVRDPQAQAVTAQQPQQPAPGAAEASQGAPDPQPVPDTAQASGVEGQPRTGQHPNFGADPVQATMPGDQDATKVRQPQPARASQASGAAAAATPGTDKPQGG